MTPMFMQEKKSCCAPSSGYQSKTLDRIEKASGADTSEMIFIKPNSDDGRIHFKIGSEDDDIWRADGEAPIRNVVIDPYYIAPTTVTNAQFEKFVEATGYETEAEKFGWSFVFLVLLPKSKQRKLRSSMTVQGLNWWYAIDGACWRKPEGSGSNIKKRMDHPVTHVSWNDAIAYCQWAGVRLPTEAEWEYAARGGLEGKRMPWGDELEPDGKHRCNVWQGDFPNKNTAEDGYIGTAPAKSFMANGFGLYNCSGNVWEWVGDWFEPKWRGRQETLDNPTGPLGAPLGKEAQKMMKGGSFLCHHSYCNRYRVAARSGNTPESATSNMGFRVVADA